MKKYKITIGEYAHIFVTTVAAAMVMVGERLDAGSTKITIEVFEHAEKNDKNIEIIRERSNRSG